MFRQASSNLLRSRASLLLSTRGQTITTRFIVASYPSAPTTRLFSSDSDKSAVKKVEDVMPIATGMEREELEAELEGRKRFDMDAPSGPFGTKGGPDPALNAMTSIIVQWLTRITMSFPSLASHA